MLKKIILFLTTFIFLFSYSNLAYAGLVINEVMYDLDGTDTGREWIEIYNDSDKSVDLSTFKFFEADTNHSLTLLEGDANIGAYGYAIIISDISKFKIDFPNFVGNIFDSSFSLSNDGEALAIKDENLNIVDEYVYNSSIGANGDGNSLQFINGAWKAILPTIGVKNETISLSTQSENEEVVYNGGDNRSSASASVNENKTTELKKIKTKIIAKNFAFTGIPVSLEGVAYGYNGEKLFSGKYFWNFGDGDSLEVNANDINNQKFSHTYFYPGEYNVNLEYYSNYYGSIPDAFDKIIVKIVEAEILISKVGDEKDFFIELSNNTNYDADISKWFLSSGGKSFILPKNTILGAKKKMIIPSKITGFSVIDKNELKLMNTQGNIVFDYSSFILAPIATISTKIEIQPNKNSGVIKPKEDYLRNENSVMFMPNDKISVDNSLASVAQSDIVRNDWDVTTIIISLVSVVFIGVGASVVYFLRRKKFVSTAGDDFDILEE